MLEWMVARTWSAIRGEGTAHKLSSKPSARRWPYFERAEHDPAQFRFDLCPRRMEHMQCGVCSGNDSGTEGWVGAGDNPPCLPTFKTPTGERE